MWPWRSIEGEEVSELRTLIADGSQVLGHAGWRLFWRYGKVMHGPNAGLYISGLPFPAIRCIIDSLAKGEPVDVHLMHMHVSGSSEASTLQLVGGRLLQRCRDFDRFV